MSDQSDTRFWQTAESPTTSKSNRITSATRRAPPAPRTMVLNMGPQHPSTHGVLRLLLELDGETILKAAPDIGYLHTGIEKEFEAKTYQQGVTLTDRIDYLAPLSNNLCLLPGGRKVAADRNPAAGAVDSRDAGGTDAPEQPSGVARHARHRHRRDERLPLLLPRARRDSAHFRNVLRPAHDDQLHPHRRPGAGASARLAEAREEVHRHLPLAASTNTKNC